MEVTLKPNLAYDVVTDRLRAEGFQAYAVGGCVRDAVMGVAANDIDVATEARPHDLTKVFGVRSWDGDAEKRVGTDGVVLYPTGVRHGTWTVRVGDDEVEVTTFRKDVETDGRNATVEFANTVEDDAKRRDFTMNALYLAPDHTVMDPTGTGLSDLLAGRVRFVGHAENRVREDYLRILRLFRFHARFGRGPMDVDAWNAASKLRYGLFDKVSGERIWDETKKLLSLHDPFEACAQMDATMLGPDLFDTWDVTALANCLRNERVTNCAPRWTRRFVALTQGSPIRYPHANSEQKAVDGLYSALEGIGMTQAVVAHQYGEITAFDWAVLQGAKPNHKEITRGAEAVFPITAQDLMDRGYKPGKMMGDELRDLKSLWVESDVELSKESLLNKIGWSKNAR